jgi:hypothetical protein
MSMSLMSFRKIGLWNRTLASGTTAFEIILAKMMFFSIIVAFNTASIIAVLKIYFDFSHIYVYLHLIVMLVLIQVIGCLQGFIFAFVANYHFAVSYLIFGHAVLNVTMGNLIWFN